MSPHITLDFTILKFHCLTNELWGYEDTTKPNPQVSPLKRQDPWLWTLGWSRAIVNLQQTGERKEEDHTHSVSSSQPHYQGKLSFLLGVSYGGARDRPEVVSQWASCSTDGHFGCGQVMGELPISETSKHTYTCSSRKGFWLMENKQFHIKPHCVLKLSVSENSSGPSLIEI